MSTLDTILFLLVPALSYPPRCVPCVVFLISYGVDCGFNKALDHKSPDIIGNLPCIGPCLRCREDNPIDSVSFMSRGEFGLVLESTQCLEIPTSRGPRTG